MYIVKDESLFPVYLMTFSAVQNPSELNYVNDNFISFLKNYYLEK